MNPIRILIADDHPVVQDGLTAVLGTQPDFEVVGKAATGMEVLQKLIEVEADILLLDLEMPGMDGVEVLHHLKTDYPQVRAIVFTAFDSDERILGAVKAGAKGYLLKGVPSEELFRAVRTVSTGGSLLQPVVASRLIEHISSGWSQEGEQYEPLTPREMDVLKQLALGETNKEIAAQLVISERTVKYHVSSILKKLGASNRTEAVAVAARLGLVALSE